MKHFFTVMLLCVFTSAASADISLRDAGFKEQNVIVAEGTASVIVPVDAVSVTFGYDAKAANFIESNERAEAIFDKIQSKVSSLGMKHVTFIKGWDRVSQAKISLGKGNNISNKLTIRVFSDEEIKFLSTVTRVIDTALSASSDIELEDVRIFLSDSALRAARTKVLTKAVRNLNEDAALAAKALNKEVGSLRQLVLDPDCETSRTNTFDGRSYYDKNSVMLESWVKKSFRVDTNIADKIEVVATVKGVFEIKQ